MKLNFCEDSKQSKPSVVCIEHDGEVSCFELGDLPPPPKDPKSLGIVFPCCINKKLNSNKHTKIKLEDEGTKQDRKDFCYRRAKPAKRVSSKEHQLPSLIDSFKNTSIVYVFDKNGFNKLISYTKANIDCADSVNPKVNDFFGQHKSLEKKSNSNQQKRILNTFTNMGKSLRACKSRELRGGVLSTDCFCLRRNGLQYDCRRSGCQNSPECSVLPGPVCEPARVACITHCANPHAEALSEICKMRPW